MRKNLRAGEQFPDIELPNPGLGNVNAGMLEEDARSVAIGLPSP